MRISSLPLLLLALPLMEIAGFVIVGRQIGALATVGLVLLSAIAGSVLLRHQGLGVMARVRAETDAGRDPSRQLAHGAMVVFAAILLIIPGFLTDIVGLLLFLPSVRDLAWRFLKSRLTIVSSFSTGMRRQPERTIDLDSGQFSRRSNPDSPWRWLGDDQSA